MPQIFKYRSIGLVLAVLFCLFNVGLPIVVASCPMMAMKSSKPCCAMQNTKSAKLGSMVNRDCCKTVFAAGRNTNEFLQVANSSNDGVSAMQCVAVLSNDLLLQNQLPIGLARLSDESPPPLSGDLPVLYSSLLI